MATITISGKSFEIYGTYNGARDYFLAAIHASAWDAAEQTSQLKALVTATRMLDRQRWKGEKTSPGQTLDWPRTGVTDDEGAAVAPGTVPLAIEHATYELANALLADVTVQTQLDAGSNVRRTVDQVSVEGAVSERTEREYFRPTLGFRGRFPTIVQELVRQFLSGGTLTSVIVSGTDFDTASPSGDFGFTGLGLP